MQGIYTHHADQLKYAKGDTVQDTFHDREAEVWGISYQVGSGKAAAGMISVMLQTEHGHTYHARTSVSSNRLTTQ